MKKILFAISIVVLFATSCKIDEGNLRPVTEAGFLVYAVTSDVVLSQYLVALDNALKIDEYMTAPDEQKNELEDLYFPKFKIRISGDTCRLHPDYATIITDGKSIREKDAKWRCIMGEVSVDISYNTTNRFNLTASESKHSSTITSTAALTVITFPGMSNDKSVYLYKISGSGSYTESLNDGPTHSIDFKIKEPLVAELHPISDPDYYTSGMFVYYKGILIMNIHKDGSVMQNDEVIAEILGWTPDYSRYESQMVNITYKGVTSRW